MQGALNVNLSFNEIHLDANEKRSFSEHHENMQKRGCGKKGHERMMIAPLIEIC